MENDFVIGRISWLTQAKRNYQFDNALCYKAFKNFINYLQTNDLTTRMILANGEEATDETSFKVSDLTEEGFMLAKKCFDKWIAKVMDNIIEPTNYKMLNNALRKIRVN